MPPSLPTAETPRLDRLLGRLGGILRRNIWLHGLGTALAAGALWLLFMYLADRVLKLPAPIRIIHLGVLVAGVVVLLRRTLFRHAREVPDRAGLAMMAQRALPEEVPKDDRFVSAIQLRESVATGATNASLVERIARDAEDVVPKADLGRITDGRGPVGRMTAGAVFSALALVVLTQNPAMARIFGARMLGADVAWPRKTTLVLEVPTGADALEVTAPTADTILVRAARGSDVPVLVTANGVVPDTILVKFDSGAAIEVSPAGKDTFRTILPSVQENTRLWVTGGDDQRGTPVVEIEVLQPPDLSSLAFVVEPPAYSGLETRTEFDTSVSVLAGSRVSVIAQTDPEGATGLARTFPDDEEIQLERRPMPPATSSGPGASSNVPGDGGTAEQDGAPETGLAFDRTANESLRFRFELTDETGLSNPDPALFGIEVLPDRRPELITLEPGRAEVETIQGGAVPLRVLTRDDFGLGTFRYEFFDAATEVSLTQAELALEDVPEALGGGSGGSRGRSARAAGIAGALLEVNDLGPDGGLKEGQVVTLQTFVTDARQPTPNETRSAPIRIRIVSADEFLRRQRDGLGRAAEDVSRIEGRLGSTLARMEEFKAAMAGDEAEAPEATDVAAALNEARRVQGDLRSVARDISALTSTMIYSRLDERSGLLESRLFELTAGSVERSFNEEAWRTLAAEAAAGQLGSAERASELVRLVGMALLAAGPQSEALAEDLEKARTASQDAAPLENARATLASASQAGEELRATIEALINDLGEWDNMQAIISLTRDIVNRQKNLTEKIRTEAEAGK